MKPRRYGNDAGAVNHGAVVSALIVAIVAVLAKLGSEPRLDPVNCGSDLTPQRDTVIMLAASWCRYCRRARALLVENDVSYCEYNIERSDVGAELYDRSGIKALPILYVHDDVIVGFDRDGILETLVAAELLPPRR